MLLRSINITTNGSGGLLVLNEAAFRCSEPPRKGWWRKDVATLYSFRLELGWHFVVMDRVKFTPH